MHFADIDKILDRRMVLTMKQDNEIFLASREIEARIPINIFPFFNVIDSLPYDIM